MKKLFIVVVMASMLVFGTGAAFVPDNEVCENRDGRQLIIKTFNLSVGDDPDSLIDEPFEREGYSYSCISIVKEEKLFESKKNHSETVTVETDSEDLSVILDALDATLPYDNGEYYGVLALDHTSLHTEATGYSTKGYTISETKSIGPLDRNDPSYVPKTTVKNGATLSLRNIEWSVQATALADDALLPSQYLAVATYSASASRKVANGYVTTATYTGEIVTAGIDSIIYTVTYLGEPLPEPLPEAKPIARRLIYAVIAVVLLLAAGTAYLLLRKNTGVYALGDDEYELIGKVWLSVRNPAIDLLSFKNYPSGEAYIEINRRAARRLFGRLIRIRLRDDIVTHRIEQTDGNNYWFTISVSD